MVSLSALMCCNQTKTVPLNYILLFLFTLGESITVAGVTSYYEPASVLFCMALLCVTTFCLWGVSMVIKTMSSYWPGMLISMVIALVLQMVALLYYMSGA